MHWSWLTVTLVVVGVVLAAVVAWVVALPWIVQPFIQLMLRFRYDLDVSGRENVPLTGPVLLVSNHMTWFDGFFLAATIPRRGTALVNAGIFGLPIIGYLAKRSGLLSIPYTGPKAQRAAIETARKALDEGRLLGIFPEGQLSRTGFTGAFHRGLEVILNGRDNVAVVPVFIDNVWGSMLSYSGGVCFWKRPQGFRRQVIIDFGPPIPGPVQVFEVRQAILAQGVHARSRIKNSVPLLETIDPSLPSWQHPALGLLTASAPDNEAGGAKQVGQKPGTTGHSIPGVAIRSVAQEGSLARAGIVGRLEVLQAGNPNWIETGRRGQIDRDGFVTLEELPAS